MIAITELLTLDAILIDPSVKSKKELLTTMIETLAKLGKVGDTKLLYSDIIAREKLLSTGICTFCAIPHAHSIAVSQTSLVAALVKKGIDFSSADCKPVKIIFLLVGPKDNASLHLKLLSRIARILHNKQFLARLSSSVSAGEFFSLIKEQEG